MIGLIVMFLVSLLSNFDFASIPIPENPVNPV
jgi:hypothetical protein